MSAPVALFRRPRQTRAAPEILDSRRTREELRQVLEALRDVTAKVEQLVEED